MSFGTHEGARDGSSDLERAIDRALLSKSGDPLPGRAVVVAAGNEAGLRRHARKTLPANGQTTFRFTLEEFDYPNGARAIARPQGNTIVGHDRIYIWYSDPASVEIKVTPPSGVAEPADWTTFGDVRLTSRVAVSSGTTIPSNGKKLFVITLWAPSMTGEWKIELRESGGAQAIVDAWVDRIGDPYTYPRFVYGDNVMNNTLTCPATAKTAIAVGGYICTPGPGEIQGGLYDQSSRGLDSAYGVKPQDTRPHILAPARRIISANNSSYVDEPRQAVLSRYSEGLQFHALMSGTSQAAPHVTGVIALMFQKNPKLTSPEILKILTATADRRQINIGLPNRDWGYGRLDARAALAAVP